jgi:hypothetical protein
MSRQFVSAESVPESPVKVTFEPLVTWKLGMIVIVSTLLACPSGVS